jgi:lipooligosaccharide transport system ATP-binding protein
MNNDRSRENQEMAERHAPDVLISAEELTKRFGSFPAVDGISFLVKRGECFGILGPNGAGKTTTVRMIYGFSPITSGVLTIFGKDASKYMREIKAHIGVCQQENNLDPDLNTFTNLDVFARYFAIPAAVRRKRALELLRFVSLENKATAKISELSGGMLRRLMLARSLLNDPDLIILDEPTTGLDPQSRHLTWELLADLKQKGKAVLLTTHYMEEAARLCDRLIIMDHGRILVEGNPATLVEEELGDHVMEVVDPPGDVVERIEKSGLGYDRLQKGLLVYGAGVSELFQEIVVKCQGGCTLRIATLEDVFLKLTGRELRE